MIRTVLLFFSLDASSSFGAGVVLTCGVSAFGVLDGLGGLGVTGGFTGVDGVESGGEGIGNDGVIGGGWDSSG